MAKPGTTPQAPQPPEIHPPVMHPPVLGPPERHPPEPGGPDSYGLGNAPPPLAFPAAEALAVPELAPPSSEHNHHRRVGPVPVIFGALILLAVGVGSAVGISYAVKSPSAARSPTTTFGHAGSSGSTQATHARQTTPVVGTTGGPPTTGGSPSASSRPAGTSPSTEIGPPGDRVTQAVTENVLATTWAGYAQAMVSNNRGLLIGFTTRSALNDSVATLDCGCLSGPLTYSTTAISAPPQVGYPLSFMAGLSGTGYNQLSQTWWVIFTKTSASAPWLVAFIAGYAEGGGLNGFTAFSALSPAPVPYPLQDAPRAYADFYQKLDETLDAGTGAPTNFAHNNLLEDEVNNTTEIDEQQKAEGLKQTFTHSVDQVSPIFAQVIHGSLYGSMECFSIRATDEITSANGSPIVQPQDQEAWGNLIPPGSYASMHFTREDDACVEESFTSGITLDSDSGGNYVISTTPSG